MDHFEEYKSDRKVMGKPLLEDDANPFLEIEGEISPAILEIQLTWSNLTYKIPSTNKVLLKDLKGSASAGSILAIMGPSGSGKTTLINLLAGNRPIRHIVTGGIYANEVPINSFPYKHLAAYVMQTDLLMSRLTPREVLTFSVNMRTTLHPHQKEARVESILRELKLEKVANNVIGSILDRGLSGGERKRVSIGVEMITKPSILLLDEPTSGLDSVAAELIIELLKEEAKRGMTIITTIHQPSVNVFNMLDDLLLLSNGLEVYQGKASHSEEYFEQIGFVCPSLTNPADYFMKILFIQNKNQLTEKEIEVLEFFEKCAKEKTHKIKHSTSGIDLKAIQPPPMPTKLRKFKYVFKRTVRSLTRSKDLTVVKLGQFIILGILGDLVYYNLGNSAEAFQNYNGFLFFATSTTIMMPVQNAILACM